MIATDDDALEDIEGEYIDEADLADDSAPALALPDNVDERRLLDALYKDLYRGDQARAVLAEAQMARIGEFNKAAARREIDGVGRLIASVPLEVYLYWVAREGHAFWHDPANIDFLARRAGGGRGNPAMLVPQERKAAISMPRALARTTLPPRSARAAAVHGVKSPGAELRAAPGATAALRAEIPNPENPNPKNQRARSAPQP